ncbi:DNRLRE domain-containing protein [Streptomyces mirabilis]|uniref:DNRLRE domain-containing protein n=1 Tax=Streptomyces mirabilis TaxID=68239 RepID=UPI0036E31485
MPEGPAQAQDEASALLMARLQDRKIEVLSARTPDSTTWALPSGELQTAAYAGPIRVKQDGKWQNIDTSLSDTGASLEPEAAAADIAVSDGGDTALASVSKGSKSFGLGWEDKLPAPVVKDDTASYDLGGGQTLTVTALAQGFSQNVVLDQQPDGPVAYRIPLDLDGLKLSQAESGHLLLKDTSGKLMAESPAPMMWDSTKNDVSGEPEHQVRVATEIETADDGTQTLVLTPAADFLATAMYPVTVDPTSTLAATTDTWVQLPNYEDSQVSSTELKSGTYDAGAHIARSYLMFDVAKFKGKHITDTNLALYSYYASTCSTTGAGTQIRRITTTWSSSDVTWQAQPSTTATGAVTNKAALGYNSSCPAGTMNFDIDAIVQAWADGSTNYGLQVRSADETDSLTWRRFRSANYVSGVDDPIEPHLTVTYNSKPGTPTPVSPGTGTATADTTPTLQAKATDSDGNKVYGHFEIWDAAGTTMIANGDSGQVASGSTFGWTATALAQGAYKWRVQSRDGTDSSAWSAWSTLTVDTTSPSAPSLTSTSHPSSASWYSATSFAGTLSATDSSGITGYAVKLDQLATTAPGTTVTQTGTGISWTGRTDGTWWVHAAAKNAAGLWSPAVHFAFNVDATAPGAVSSLKSSTHPLNTDTYKSRTASFSWTAPADLSGVAGYAVKVDQSPSTLPATTDGYQTGTTYSTTVSGDGTWYVHVRAKDKAGNWSSAAEHFVFHVDATLPPSPVITSSSHPDQAGAYRSGAFAASWTAPAGGATGYSVLVDDKSGTVPDTTVDTTSTSYNTTKPDGTWYLHIRAVDSAGNWGATANYRFTVDTVAPAAPAVDSSDYPSDSWAGAGGQGGVFVFTPDTGTASVTYTLDDGSAVTTATGADPAQAEIAPATDGVHTLKVSAADKAGNTSDTVAYFFYAGSARLISPVDRQHTAHKVVLTAQAPPGVTGVTFSYRPATSDTWTTIPADDVVRQSDSGAVSWPVTLTGQRSNPLVWDVIHTVREGDVEVRADFTGTATPPSSDPVTLVVDESADGAALHPVGGGQVNLLNGDFSVHRTDATLFGTAAGRTASSRTDASSGSIHAPVFGPGWVSAADAGLPDASDVGYSGITALSDHELQLQPADGSGDSPVFTLANGIWTASDYDDITISGSTTDSQLTVTVDNQTLAVFTHSPQTAGVWNLDTVVDNYGDSDSALVSQIIGSGASAQVRPQYQIARGPVPTATCASHPSTAGCRVLEYHYATATTATSSTPGDVKDQVSGLTAWSSNAPGAAATAVDVAAFTYDTTGRLRASWDPQITPTLQTSYTYDGAGRLASLAEPGQRAWTYTYADTASGPVEPGMLLSASHPALAPGTRDTAQGDTVVSLVYGVPLSGSAAPNQMDTEAVSHWGQHDAPLSAVAVFPPDAVPASPNGSQLQAAAYRRASITYLNLAGYPADQALPGGHITTSEYDAYGHVIRDLTASARELVLCTGAAQQQALAELNLACDTPPAQAVAADALSTTHLYSADGENLLEENGPVHMVELAQTLKGSVDHPAGDVLPARQRTTYTYDQGKPDGSSQSGLLTATSRSLAVDGYPAQPDTTESTTYDWDTGLPISSTVGVGDLNLKTVTNYDSDGKTTQITRPSSGGTRTTHWNTGTTDCAGHPEWIGLVCRIDETGGTPTRTHSFTYDRWGNRLSDTLTAGTHQTTTTTTRDGAGRTTRVATVSDTGTTVAPTTTAYDAANGMVGVTTTGSVSITRSYDTLGRLISYKDGAGNTETTAYDSLDRVVTQSDSAPSTRSWTYDTSADPRGIATGLHDSQAGDLAAAYDPDGNLVQESLPGGVKLAVSYSQTGEQTSRAYTAGDGTVLFSETAQYDIDDHVTQRTQTAGKTVSTDYTYDAAGRLTDADDSDGQSCTSRRYTLDVDGNRTALRLTSGDCAGQSDQGSTNTAYDAADELVSQNGATVARDPFGRLAALPDGTGLDYYADGSVHSATTASNTRATWAADGLGRLATEDLAAKDQNGTWTPTVAMRLHYAADDRVVAWSADSAAGTVQRKVQGLDARTEATTTGTGPVVLQLSDIQGNVTVQYSPADSGVTVIGHGDEYGSPGDSSVTGWSAAINGTTPAVGALTTVDGRVYASVLGRFVTQQPDTEPTRNNRIYADNDPLSPEPTTALGDLLTP